jgi:cytochrome c peroxidase
MRRRPRERVRWGVRSLAPAGPPTGTQDALGRDYNNDGRGIGYNIPSLLGIDNVQPYYHNGACETLDCVVGNAKHRTANGRQPDRLTSLRDRRRVVAFLKSID